MYTNSFCLHVFLAIPHGHICVCMYACLNASRGFLAQATLWHPCLAWWRLVLWGGLQPRTWMPDKGFTSRGWCGTGAGKCQPERAQSKRSSYGSICMIASHGQCQVGLAPPTAELWWRPTTGECIKHSCSSIFFCKTWKLKSSKAWRLENLKLKNNL